MGVSVALLISLLCCIETVQGQDNSTEPQNNGSLSAWPFDWFGYFSWGPNRTVQGHDNSTQPQNNGSLAAWLFDLFGYFRWGHNRTVIGNDNSTQRQNNGSLTSQACTKSFENRIIRLEYLYYKSYWLSHARLDSALPSIAWTTRSDIFDHTYGFSWKLIKCGDDLVCFESMRQPYHVLSAYFNGKRVGLEYLSDIKRDAKDNHKFYIHCNSCKKSDSCWIHNVDQSRLYSSHEGYLYTMIGGGHMSWFLWDIVLSLPMERWDANVRRVCNNETRNIGVHWNELFTVGVSKMTSSTRGLSIEMGFAMQGDPVTWSYTGKVTQTNEWTSEEQYDAEHKTHVTIRGTNGTNGILVPPKKAAVLKQLIGYYGQAGDFQTPFKSSSLDFMVNLEDC